MNPILLVAGVIALLAWRNKPEGQLKVAKSDEPTPSPANPSGLDKPSGPSTTSDPIASPANPAGLDRPSEPIQSPSDSDTLQKEVERVADEGSEVKDTTNYEIVDDGNWSPSPSNSKSLEQELMLGSPTPVSSPANPKGLVDIVISNEDSKSGSSSSDPIASPANPKGLDTPTGTTTKSDPQTGLSLEGANTSGKIVFGTGGGGKVTIGFDKNYPFLNKKDSVDFEKLAKSNGVGSYQSFVNWLLGQTGFTSAQAGAGKLASAPYKYRVYLLAKQKGLLNEATIKEYILVEAEMKRRRALEDERAKERAKEKAAKGYPAVLSGRVHMGNGQYADPTKGSDCPLGYKFLNRRGWTGCVSEERYAEVMSEMAKDYPLLPPKQWSQAILLKYAGSLSDKSALTMPTDKLIDLIRENAKGCNNKWCKVINDSFITDSTSFVRERFEFRGVIFGKMDENWIAFYPIPVKVGFKERKKDLPYVMFPLSEQEFNTFKELAKYHKASK